MCPSCLNAHQNEQYSLFSEICFKDVKVSTWQTQSWTERCWGGCQAITVFIFYEKQQVCSASPAWTNKGWVYHRRQYEIFGCLICDFNLRGQGENDTDYCFNCMCRSQDFSFWEGSELLTAATLGWLKQMLCVKTRSTGTHKHSPQQNSS